MLSTDKETHALGEEQIERRILPPTLATDACRKTGELLRHLVRRHPLSTDAVQGHQFSIRTAQWTIPDPPVPSYARHYISFRDRSFRRARPTFRRNPPEPKRADSSIVVLLTCPLQM